MGDGKAKNVVESGCLGLKLSDCQPPGETLGLLKGRGPEQRYWLGTLAAQQTTLIIDHPGHMRHCFIPEATVGKNSPADGV